MQNDEKIGSRIRQFRLTLELDQGQFASKLNISQQQLSKYENSYVEPSTKFYVKLCEVTDINLHWLLTGQGDMAKHQPCGSGMYFIPYWNESPIAADKLKKSTINDGFFIDVNVIINEWNCRPENARLISTPGEDMDGGQYPIRNKDLLVIDISKNEITDSGIYLITTQGGKIVMLRRLMELADGSVAFYIDNEKYAFAINKTYTNDELKAMDFKVIGRVVKNVTYTL